MKGTTHAAIGMVSSVFIAKTMFQADLSDIGTLSAVLALGNIGGLLPDIDHAGSTLGQKIPILPKLLKHRGITHTVYFVLLLTGIAVFFQLPVMASSCFIVAVCSHLLADMLTPAGIFPFRISHFFAHIRFRINICRYPIVESAMHIGMLLLLCYLLAN